MKTMNLDEFFNKGYRLSVGDKLKHAFGNSFVITEVCIGDYSIKSPNDKFFNVLKAKALDEPIPQTKEVEWENGLPPVGAKVMCSYTDTDCDGWFDMHGPSDVIAYHGDYVWIAHHGKFNRVHELRNIEFERPESPEAKKDREAAWDLYRYNCSLISETERPIEANHWSELRDEIKDYWLAVVRKTGYRVEK